MDYNNLGLLVEIAKKGIFSEIETSTTELSRHVNVSQQTISRKLRQLEEQGLIIRKPTPEGHKLRISAKGILELKGLSTQLRLLFSRKKQSISGILFTGEGEGRYYMSIPRYKSQIKEKLGFTPFPGTLNIRGNSEDIDSFLFPLQSIEIPEFQTPTREFGSIACYNVDVEGIKGAIVIPQRTRYGKDVMEIIAPVNLRAKLKLKDGDRVRVRA